MDEREKIARGIAGLYWKTRQEVDDRWHKWLPEADAAIAAMGGPDREDEAWKVAQLAATIAAPMAPAGMSFEWADIVKSVAGLLAEARRQLPPIPAAP